MREITEAMQVHLAQEVTTLATCWSIGRKDGVLFRFTDHDADLVVGGQVFTARHGINPTAVSAQLGLAVDNLELEGMLGEDGIAEADLLAGKFDHAAVRIFMVNYQAPDAGELPLAAGWLGEVQLNGGSFVAEIRSVSALLQQSVGEVYTNYCRARLGDGRCKLDLAALTVTGTVGAVENAYQFHDGVREEARNYFAYGMVTFTSGANEGLSMEVREFAGGRFSLFLPMPAPIAVGDGYRAVAGCDKAFGTCVGRFANALNFRGEPHVPGPDKMLETSATRAK